MWKNYLTVAIRNTWKNKVYVSINVLGLGIAMAFSLTIYLLFAYNNEFDAYYKNTKNIYRIHELKQNPGAGFARYDLAPLPMGPLVAQQVAGVESQVRFMLYGGNLKYEDQVFYHSIGYVDENFFELFNLKLKSGSPSLLKDRNRIFITREVAKKYFGDSDPVGKVMTLHYASDRFSDFTVAGVFDKIPTNSTFVFEVLTHFDNFLYGQNIKPDDWTAWQQPTTFLKLTDPRQAKVVEARLNDYLEIQNNNREEWKVGRFELIQFRDGKILNVMKTNGSNGNLRVGTDALSIFSFMALLILLIACFNLANTTMALMGNRVREIGVRKVMGGASRQVFAQFMFEMSWTAFLALLFGMATFQWVASGFFTLWGGQASRIDVSLSGLILAFTGLFFLTTSIAGLYPAVYSRKFQPVAIFNNRLKLKGAGLTSWILNALQFTFSLIVLVGGMVFLQNAKFLKSLDLGYQHKTIINMVFDDKAEYKLMEDKIQNYPGITSYASTADQIGGYFQDTYLVMDTGTVEIRSRRVGEGYLDLMGIKLTSGRLFDKNRESDFNESVIVNQTFIEKFGFKDPIGSLVNLRDGKRYIIGVTGDIVNNVYRGYESIPEIFLPAKEEDSRFLVVKTEMDNREAVFDWLTDAWKEVIPYKPFNGYYQENMAMGGALQTTNNLKTIFFYLAILGSLLSLTGIFALSTLNVASKLKEIGIRKVMGATPKGILMRLNRRFMVILSISTLGGGVVSYFMVNMVLSTIYEYHTSVKIYTLILAALAIAGIAMATTAYTILKAANTNPAMILRNE